MSSLGASEIYKYDHRVKTFLKKLSDKEPFVLTNGLKVVLVDSEQVREALANKVPVKNIPLFGEDGKPYSFAKLSKTPEFGGGGGSGAGAAITALGESAQALYAQALFDYNSTDKAALRKAYDSVDVTASLDDLLTKLPEAWIQSSILGAQAIKDNLYKQGVTFHRGSKWVEGLQRHFNNLNKQEGNIFGNVNKWSPADIYMLSAKGATIPFHKTTTLIDLNSMLYQALKSKDVVGISLKQMSGRASFKYLNVGEEKEKAYYKSYTVAKTKFFNAMDTFVFFNDNSELQLRDFSGSFQGEIKGTKAAQGKIGYGVIAAILRQKFEVKAPEINDIKRALRDSRQEFLKTLYVLYQQLDTKDSPKMNASDFIAQANKQEDSWLISKFMGCTLIQMLLSLKLPRKWRSEDDPRDVFVSSLISYASSQSDLSGPYAKVE